MNVIFDFDDLTWHGPENCLRTINELVRRIPDIKLSFFTIPHFRNLDIFADPIWCSEIRRHMNNNNVRLGLHGLRHQPAEFLNISYDEAKQALIAGEMGIRMAGLVPEKVFKAPYWQINEATYQAAVDCGYTHIYNHADFKQIGDKFKDKIKSVYYTWNLKDAYAADLSYNINGEEWIVAHGHCGDYVCDNGIGQVKDKMIEFCNDFKPNYKFIHEI